MDNKMADARLWFIAGRSYLESAGGPDWINSQRSKQNNIIGLWC